MHDTIIEQIHEASLLLLENPGVRMEHDGIVDLLIKKGAKPGSSAQTVRIPREMIQECLALCPREVALADRNGNATRLTAEAGLAVWSCPGMKLHENGSVRPFLQADMARVVRLLDQLPHLQGVFGMAMNDVVPRTCDVVGLLTMARHTRKHLRAFCFTPEGGQTMREMKTVVGNYPWFSIGFTAHGPLRWTHLALSIFKETSGAGIPVTVNGEPMAGTSGPVTLAGSAAVGNAEILAGIAAIQLWEPGRPVIHNLGLAHVFDMRTTIAVTGGPENALLADLGARLGRFYNLPSASWVSTEAMCPDAQASLEKMFGFSAHIRSGVRNIWGLGQLESELTLSPAQAVIDDDMLGYIMRYMRGVEANEDTLAVEVTRSVGIGGQYLDHEHTFAHFREELFQPALLLRHRREDWEASGSKDLTAVAEERAQRLMKNEVAGCLTPEQDKELERIQRDFVKKMA